MVNRFKRLIGTGRWASLIRGGVPVAEAVVQETPGGCRYWSVLPNANREYLEKSGYYDELWSVVSVTCDPTEDSKLMSFCTSDRKTASTESTSPKLLCVACNLVSKQLHKGQDVEKSPTNARGILMFPWSRPNGSSSSVREADGRPDSTPTVHIKGDERQFQPQPNAKNIPCRFLANPSVLVPNHLMIFNESKPDLDMHQSMPKDTSVMIHVGGTEMSERTGLKNELPTSMYQEHNDNIMKSTGSCSIEMGDHENSITSSYRDAIAVSATMESEDHGMSELSQTLIDSVDRSSCLTPSGFAIFETNGICLEKTSMEPHDNTSSTVSSVCDGDREPADGVTIPVSDGLELLSAAEIHSDAVTASNYSLHCKSSPARKGEFSLRRDFRAFSIDVPETCSSNDPRMTSIFNGQTRPKDDLICHQVSIQSDSSGFTEGDQLDASLLSINDALAPYNRLQNMETHGTKDTSCSQCLKSADFINSHRTQRPFSEGRDDFFHMFSQSSYKPPHCPASTQTDSSDVSSVSHHKCFSVQNISQGAATHRRFKQNLLNNGVPSKVERKTTTGSDDLCAFIIDRSCVVSGDCLMSGGDASKQYRTEITVLVNQSSPKLQNLETSSAMSQSSACELKTFCEYHTSSSLEMDVVNKKNNRNDTSVICRLDQSSPVKEFGLSRSTRDSQDGHQSETVMSCHSSPVRYQSNYVSCRPDQQSLSVSDQNQTRNLRNSFDIRESYNWSDGVELSPSSDDSGSASVFYERQDECFLDASEHQMLLDQLENSGFVSPLNWPSTPISSTPKWKQCARDELKLMDFALRKYKLQNKVLHRRMCKTIDFSGCSSSPGVLLSDERDDLDMLENLHTEIMEELDKMEELLMQRLKRFLRCHGYKDEEHLPLNDFTSQCILHSMNRLLHEQDYQSNIVNSLNSTGSSDHLSSTSPLVSSPPLLLHSLPIVSLQQLSQCLASVEMLLLEIQRKGDVMEKNSTPFQQPVQKLNLDPNKDLKRRKSYHRFLPACLKPQWPKKQPVFKQQMSLPNIKEDH